MHWSGVPLTQARPPAPKQPIKNLPASVELPADGTVEDLKKQIANAARISDYNRIGIFNPATKRTLKDRKAKLANEKDVITAGEVLVKDLGKPFSLFVDLFTYWVLRGINLLTLFKATKSPGAPSSSSNTSVLS